MKMRLEYVPFIGTAVAIGRYEKACRTSIEARRVAFNRFNGSNLITFLSALTYWAGSTVYRHL